MADSLIKTKVSGKLPGAYRVLHTADWHLGKLLGEHSREVEHQRFLSFLLKRIHELSVDALVIAGDIFDSANPPQSAVAQYYDFLSALFRQGGCSVIVVAGNHDSPAHLEAPRQILHALGAHVVGAMPENASGALVLLPDPRSPQLLIAAVPFLRDRDLRLGQSGQNAAEIQQSLVTGIQRRYDEVAAAAKPWIDKNIPVLATGHLTVVGSKVSDSEREIHVGGLGAIGAECFPKAFAYVALGHLHRPQAAGDCETVRYAGSPIPLSFSEAEDSKSVQLLDFAEGKLVGQFTLELPSVRRLIQLTTSRQMLESVLVDFQPALAEFPAWVELVIEDPVAGENLYEHVQQITQGKAFQVIRMVGKRTNSVSGMPAAAATDAEGITDLLAEPARIFAHKLDAEISLTTAERESLKTIFQELLDLHTEQQRQAETVADAKPKPGGVA